MMEWLAEFDPIESIDGLQGTVQWAPNDAYAQTHDNKPEYAGRVRGVSKNILPVQSNIHLYYTPSQARSKNAPPSVVIFEMIEKVVQVKKGQHKQEMEEHLAQQREEHKQSLEAMNATITE
jgi:hypothetical protein